jgi:hypothetical protein
MKKSSQKFVSSLYIVIDMYIFCGTLNRKIPKKYLKINSIFYIFENVIYECWFKL